MMTVYGAIFPKQLGPIPQKKLQNGDLWAPEISGDSPTGCSKHFDSDS